MKGKNSGKGRRRRSTTERPAATLYGRRHFLQLAGIGVVGGLATPSLLRATPARARSEPIRIGAINHLTGPLSAIGIDELHGIEIAVAKANEDGGVNGRKIELISEDDGSKPAAAVDKASKLIGRDKVDVLVGVVSTSVSLALQDLVKDAKVIFVNAGSGSDTIMLPKNNSRYFFHAKWDNSQVTLAAGYVAKQQKPGARWYFVGSDYEWGHDSVDKMRKQAEKAAELEVAGTQFVPLGTPNFAPIVTQIASAKPDVIALALPGADYSGIIRQIALFGLKAHLHHDYASTIEAAGAGDAALGLTGGVDFVIDYEGAPLARPFAEQFHKKYGAWPSWTAAGGATAVQTYLAAVKRAGGTGSDDVIAAMEAEPFADTVKGKVWYRACDHQLVVPIHAAEFVRGSGGREYGLKVLDTFPPEEVEKLMRACQA